MSAADSSQYDTYQSPLTGRYAAKAMTELFSPRTRVGYWRKLWLALAEAQCELGLEQVSLEALTQMRAHLDDINFDVAEAREREVRHDVMAHVHAFGQQAPAAAGIIHLGATSCFVTDNADLLILRKGLAMLREKVLGLISAFANFCEEYADQPCMGATHLQPAQLTTVGKRATLWLNDLLGDFYAIHQFAERTPLRGVKGTTGTQASFLALFTGLGLNKEEAGERVKQLERKVCEKMGVGGAFPVTGQTYSRKVDHVILSAIAGIGVTLHKFASDMRLLMSVGELEEPFGEKQIGSSAMAYKRNPMRSERICSLSRHLLSLADQAGHMASQQWLERTLDDSAVRRVILPEAFLIADIILSTAINVASGIVVRKGVCERRINDSLPFMATEEIIMEHSRRGGDRQQAHEVIREHSQAVVQAVRNDGAKNDLLECLAADAEFAGLKDFIATLSDPTRFIGRAPEQTREFLADHVRPLLAQHGTGETGEGVNV